MRVLDEDVVVSAVCSTGEPRCGAQIPPPQGSERHAHDDVDAWMEDHLRATGHDLFTEIHREPVRWGPPAARSGPGAAGT
ncbi:DUF7848 domain-containing protein [Streptomyces sp. NPDC003860]